jgi:hypothetical protein
MNRRGFVGLLAGLSGLLVMGRSKPAESKQERVSETENGQKLYASVAWVRDRDFCSTVVYWLGKDGIIHLYDMYECTAEQIVDRRCRCRRYIPSRTHDEDRIGHWVAADIEQWEHLRLPSPCIETIPFKEPDPALFDLLKWQEEGLKRYLDVPEYLT